MQKLRFRTAACAALLAPALLTLLSVPGCIVAGPSYRYENGDRIDRYGHREVHWCDAHRDDEHCH